MSICGFWLLFSSSFLVIFLLLSFYFHSRFTVWFFISLSYSSLPHFLTLYQSLQHFPLVVLFLILFSHFSSFPSHRLFSILFSQSFFFSFYTIAFFTSFSLSSSSFHFRRHHHLRLICISVSFHFHRPPHFLVINFFISPSLSSSFPLHRPFFIFF